MSFRSLVCILLCSFLIGSGVAHSANDLTRENVPDNVLISGEDSQLRFQSGTSPPRHPYQLAQLILGKWTRALTGIAHTLEFYGDGTYIDTMTVRLNDTKDNNARHHASTLLYKRPVHRDSVIEGVYSIQKHGIVIFKPKKSTINDHQSSRSNYQSQKKHNIEKYTKRIEIYGNKMVTICDDGTYEFTKTK